ncbi:MAG: cyclic nucleotide-binding domain-containing protein [Chloroflexi bacterium]|nr:cyclic nucleotide-binding domain-containing protein [Chloroflexota bacterium]
MKTALRSTFLKDLDQEQLEILAPMFEPFQAPASTIIFKQGEPTSYLYFLINGTAAIRYKPHDGSPITLTHLHPGDVFGWSAVVGNNVYTSSALATTEIETIRVHCKDLKRFCQTNPELGYIVLEKLAENVYPRWKNSREQIRNIFGEILSQPNIK